MPDGPGGVELFAPAITVTLDDGTTWTIATGNPDLVAWDMTAAKHKWPGVKDAPFLWLTFLAWHASRRKGALPDPGMTWEQFKTRAENVVGPDGDDDDDAGMIAVRPTLPDPAPD